MSVRISEMRCMTRLSGEVKLSMTVKIRHASTIGLTYGSVIFQKNSQPVAPSSCAASRAEAGIFCNAARKIRIWMPAFHTMPKIDVDTVEIMVSMLAESP